MADEATVGIHKFDSLTFMDHLIAAGGLDAKIVPIVHYLDDVIEGTAPLAGSLQASPETQRLIDEAKGPAEANIGAYLAQINAMMDYLRSSNHVLEIECVNEGRKYGLGSSYTINIRTPNFSSSQAVRDPALTILEALEWRVNLSQKLLEDTGASHTKPKGTDMPYKLVGGTNVRKFMGSLQGVDLAEEGYIDEGRVKISANKGSAGKYPYWVEPPMGGKLLLPLSYASALDGLTKLMRINGVRFQFLYTPLESKPG